MDHKQIVYLLTVCFLHFAHKIKSEVIFRGRFDIYFQLQFMSTLKEGFQYIEGDGDLPGLARTQMCCGSLVGSCKAWIPCLGCFCCCCNNPFVSIPQGSKGLKLSFKKYDQTCGAGLHYINPMTEEMVIIDCRISVVNLPPQRVMTKDNISITVDSCIYFHIKEPHLTYFRVDNVETSLVKITGGVIKNTVAIFTFQQLLEKKTSITEDIEKQIKPVIQHWGIAVDTICLKNFAISKQLEQELVSAPVARRNAESKILNASGQVQIAKLLGERSKVLNTVTAIQVRYLQTLKDLARNGSSRMIYRSHG